MRDAGEGGRARARPGGGGRSALVGELDLGLAAVVIAANSSSSSVWAAAIAGALVGGARARLGGGDRQGRGDRGVRAAGLRSAWWRSRVGELELGLVAIAGRGRGARARYR